MVWNEWADADHLWIQFLEKQHIFGKIFCCLVGRAYHESGTDLIAYGFQIPEALLPCLGG